jgi:hypothetical protein
MKIIKNRYLLSIEISSERFIVITGCLFCRKKIPCRISVMSMKINLLPLFRSTA